MGVDPVSATIAGLALAFSYYQYLLGKAEKEQKRAIIDEIEHVRNVAEYLLFDDFQVLSSLRKLANGEALTQQDHQVFVDFENDQADVLQALEALKQAAKPPDLEKPTNFPHDTREMLRETFKNKGELRSAVWPAFRGWGRGEVIAPETANTIIENIEDFNSQTKTLIAKLNGLLTEKS